ncbi:MAG TPA: sialidase family protein [Thermoanaerobaculia bacterium]|jgi:hypothetical protein|nr:sialidase family protein [Thermoanaerobaculia bacterium]
MRSLIALSALLLVSVAPLPSSPVTPIPFPFGHATSEPYVVADGSGGFDLSWLDGRTKSFQFARYDGAKWSKATVITHGKVLENRADYPSIAVSGRAIAAQWREGVGEEGARILLARSSDGGATWSKPVTPHPVMEREFGFVSMLPLANGATRIAWLDGRASAHEGEGNTQLRAATMTAAGLLTDDVLVDGRVCDCCQTSMAMTSRGPLVAYRDRSEKEIRDIAIAPPQASAHNTPVHADGWLIKGCPVNGPRIDAHGSNIAVAWFSGANGKQVVNVAFSRDGGLTFGAPIHAGAQHDAGRVDIVLLSDGTSAVVTWVERAGTFSKVMARRVSSSGTLGTPEVLGKGMSLGFPRIAISNEHVLAAWSGDDGIQLATIDTHIR